MRSSRRQGVLIAGIAGVVIACGGTTADRVGKPDPGGGGGFEPTHRDAGGGAHGFDASAGGRSSAGTDGSPAVGDGGDSGRPDARTLRDAGDSGGCRPVPCLDAVTECGDCIDNDHDGLTDLDDDGCLAVCDGSEDSFRVDIFGDPGSCYSDCAFDGNTGSGDDLCRWDTGCWGNARCLQHPLDCQAPTTPRCVEACLPLTPNGCDCFGCCELVPGAFFAIGSPFDATCSSLDEISDPSRCRPCEPVADCFNPCDDCELCVTRRIRPEGCRPPEECPGTACGLQACPNGELCVNGCCVHPP